VLIHGFVEDLRPFYARAAVVLVPLEVSAGTNIKVLEAMACGKAIVSTPVGCAGLGLEHRRELLIASDWPAFEASITELLFDPQLRTELGYLGRQAAIQRFSWTAIAASAYTSYQTIALCAL
jgi:glycosyltransferase involved in cell wall biosynthesis